MQSKESYMKSEFIVLNEERNVTLKTFIQPVGGEFSHIKQRPAVIILPGGGYQKCSDREAEVIAYEYLCAGYHAFVLKYSLNENALWPNPLNDYEEAMKLIRGNAKKWNIYEDKIAVIGFSAGGHLASAAAVLSEEKPDAAILGYALIEKAAAKSWLASAPSICDKVNKDTCPCFVFATRTDNIVPVNNSIKFINALDKEDIGFECHIYSYGPHGYSTGNTAVQFGDWILPERAKRWVPDSIAWLKDIFGDFAAGGGLTEPICKRKMYDDREPFYSINCRLGYLMKQPALEDILDPILEKIKARVAEAIKDSSLENAKSRELDGTIKIPEMLMNISLLDIFRQANVPETEYKRLDAALRSVEKSNSADTEVNL